MVFVGPDARVINSMGLKHTARELAIAAGVPVIKGSGLLKGPDEALQEARKLGFPVRGAHPCPRSRVKKAVDYAEGLRGRRWYGPADLLH